MQTWIALFRGVNVGGKNILPMSQLRSALEALELRNVRTYIQSGNVIFDSPGESRATLTDRIARRIEKQHGFRPTLLILTRDELHDVVRSNPFINAIADAKTLHFYFLAAPPSDPNRERLDELRSPTEEYALTNLVFYLHAPGGIARSKLAANVEKQLGVAVTARNYRTVAKLESMVMST